MKARRLFLTSILFGAIFMNIGQAKIEPEAVQSSQELDLILPLKLKLKYLIHLPEGYRESEGDWPLILFLHGAGERGDELSQLNVNGPPMLIEKGKWNFPGIVVSPQCPKDQYWNNPEKILALEALLDSLELKYRVDSTRVYLTGLSMGGFGTWSLAAHAPERFAAIAPICGGGEPLMSRKLNKMPIWVFHGEKDTVIPVERSKQMVEALIQKGSSPRFTVYPDEGHASWVPAYETAELYEWFLSHCTKDRE